MYCNRPWVRVRVVTFRSNSFASFLATRFERLTLKVLSESLITILSQIIYSYLLPKIYQILTITVIKCFMKKKQYTYPLAKF